MGRPKTISDDDVLRVARKTFQAKGHTASTRAVADAAGISEAVLYQRFGSKDVLFFRAMHATGPDVERLLGPIDPPDDARIFLRRVVVRVGKYFAEVIPLALHVMTHPSFDRKMLGPPGGPAELKAGLAARIEVLVRNRKIVSPSPSTTARLLISLAHDWALGLALRHIPNSRNARDLEEMVDVIWAGLKPGK
ncbi:MAG TPA: TetR/AcrR family transcriptional regulator [Fimbriiglobus sp.]|jgi:AcrR family transcriptional regulator